MPTLSDFAEPPVEKKKLKKKKKLGLMVMAKRPDEPASLEDIVSAPSDPAKEMSEDEDPKNFMGEINVGVSKR